MATATPDATTAKKKIEPPRDLWLIWDDDEDTWAVNCGTEFDEPDHFYWFDSEEDAESFCNVMCQECGFNYRPIHVRAR